MFKHTRAGLLVALAIFLSMVLAACGPSSATDTPAPAATTAAASSATTAAASAATTAAASSATTAAASSATTAAAAASGSGGEIRIGVMGPLTGPSATFGTAITRGIDMALEDFQAAGGLNGRKITLIQRDDKADPETGINNVRDLIDKEKVLALIGTANTAVGTKQAPIVNQAKVPWIIPVTTGTVITQDATSTPSYIFRVSMVDAEQTPFAANYALDNLKTKKIALINDDSGYGTLGKADVLKALDARGVKPVLEVTYKVGDTSDNFKPMVTQIKQAAPDVIINWGLGAEAANIRKAMKELGVETPMIGSWGLSQPNFLQLAGDLSNGVLVPQTISVDTSNPKQQAFFDRYRKKYNTDSVGFPSGLAQSYDAMTMLLNAIKQSGGDTQAKVRDALEATGSYDGIVKKYDSPFKNQYHEAFTKADFIMTVWKDGKMVKAAS